MVNMSEQHGAPDKSLTGLAGEYHVLAQLAERGYVGALTLGHTKGVDILVSNPRSGRVRTVEVKTTRRGLRNHPLFGSSRFYAWPMSHRHEATQPPDLVYCFVVLGQPGEPPKFFIVPAHEVAEYVRWQHQVWLMAKTGRNDNAMRTFRIEQNDPKGYRDNWTLFD
jgi:hypothetical protein